VIFRFDQIAPHRMDNFPRRVGIPMYLLAQSATANRQTWSHKKRCVCEYIQKRAVRALTFAATSFALPLLAKNWSSLHYDCIICRQTSHSRAKSRKGRERHAHRRRQINCSRGRNAKSAHAHTPKQVEYRVRFLTTPTPFTHYTIKKVNFQIFLLQNEMW